MEKISNFESGKEKINKKVIEEHIVKIFENGLDDEECIGYHGTSLEAIEYMREHGHLPGSAEANDDYDYEKGSLFFYPRKSKFPDHPDADKFHSNDKEAIEDAAVYADIIARFHYIVKALGLDLDNPKHQYIGRVLGEGDSYEADEIIEKLIVENNKTKKEIKDILKEARKRKGVVIALDNKVLENHKLGSGDDTMNGHDLRIICPEGLNFKLISGLEPIGQSEWEYFQNLQNKEK